MITETELINRINELIPKYNKAKFLHNGRDLKEGIDCLGFIVLFYDEFGIDVPSDDGEYIDKNWYKEDPDRYIRGIKNFCDNEVDIDNLKPLDMVYFALSRDIITHTGIMINNREFIHMSPRSGLLISKLERGWKRRLKGAVRFIKWK